MGGSYAGHQCRASCDRACWRRPGHCSWWRRALARTGTRVDHDGASSTRYERTLAPDSRVISRGRSETVEEHDVVDLDGPGFDDLTPAQRAAVLRQAGADAVMTVRIVVGARTGVWVPNQSAEVQVKLAVDAGDTLAWVSRCIASSHDFATVDAALEGAARCAVRGVTGR